MTFIEVGQILNLLQILRKYFQSCCLYDTGILFCTNFSVLLRIWKTNLQNCGSHVEEFAWDFFNHRRIRHSKPSLIILEQYLWLYNVVCDPTYALIKGSEVHQSNQTFEFSINSFRTQEHKGQLDCKEISFKRWKKIV